MKAKSLSFLFICFHLFFRIGTFQWVTAEKNKNFARIPLAPAMVVQGGEARATFRSWANPKSTAIKFIGTQSSWQVFLLCARKCQWFCNFPGPRVLASNVNNGSP